MPELRDMNHPAGGANVVGAWHLDEASGTTVNDWSTSGYNFTYDLAPATPTPIVTPTQSNGTFEWYWGGALGFDGGDGTARLGAAANLQLQTFSIETLTYIPGTYTFAPAAIISYFPKGANSVGLGWLWGVNNTGAIEIALGNGSGSFKVLLGSPHPIDSWIYTAFTYTNSDWRIYRRGVLDRTDTVTPYVISYADNGGFPGDVHSVNIGRAHNSNATPNFFWKGFIADIRISNVVRTPSEISAMQEWLFPTSTPTTQTWGGPPLTTPPRFSSYSRYKTIRAASQMINNLQII